jgi:hypothetical protein
MTAAQTMEGIYGNTAYALPHDRVKAFMKAYIKDIPKKELKPDVSIRLPQDLLDAYSGVYTNTLARPVIVSNKDGKLLWARDKTTVPRELLPVSKDVFMLKGDFARIVFNREQQQVAIVTGNAEMVYKKNVK